MLFQKQLSKTTLLFIAEKMYLAIYFKEKNSSDDVEIWKTHVSNMIHFNWND